MSSAGAVSIQSARLSQMGVNRQVLKEGSSVLVRVIADRGGGKYEGSVAGVRVQLNSAKALTPGQSFTATIAVKNGSIVITPKDNALAAMAANEIALSFNEVTETQLFALVPDTNESFVRLVGMQYRTGFNMHQKHMIRFPS